MLGEGGKKKEKEKNNKQNKPNNKKKPKPQMNHILQCHVESHRKRFQNFLCACSLSYCVSMYIVTVKQPEEQ